MSDVLYHARPTPSQQAAINHQSRLRASIEARAEALNNPVPVAAIEAPQIVPVTAPSPHEIAHRITALKREIQELANQNAILLRAEATKAPPKVTQIREIVAKHFGLTEMDLQSERRDKKSCWARQVAVYLCRQLTARSLITIGQAFGGRDHSTISHSVDKIADARSIDPALDAELAVLTAQII